MYYLAPPECGVSSFVLVLGRSHNPHCCHVDEPKAAENQGKPSKKTIINMYKYMQFPTPPTLPSKKKPPNVQKMSFNVPSFAEGFAKGSSEQPLVGLFAHMDSRVFNLRAATTQPRARRGVNPR